MKETNYLVRYYFKLILPARSGKPAMTMRKWRYSYFDIMAFAPILINVL